MNERARAPFVLVAAGGTGGHLFPAQALSVALRARGVTVDLATDERAVHYGPDFPARETHILPSATLRGRNPVAIARTVATLGLGVAKAWSLLGRLKPDVVVGFGGYPTVPPVLAASLRGIPTVLHEQNGVMGRANRFLSSRVTAIASSMRSVAGMSDALRAKTTFTGNPVRPNVIAAAAVPYAPPVAGGSLNLLVFGGSQGARVMADVVPSALALLDAPLRARIAVTQQARGEDIDRAKASYAHHGIAAEVAAFFSDLPDRIARAHLVVSRSGASTVAELAVIGRPAILVPLPHALDQDQFANATMLAEAGGAICIAQRDFTPNRLAAELAALSADSARLAGMAAGARSAGAPDAAEKLADLVLRVAKR
ncbi:MAG: undecaprenyldiphospho-muramoylpentapeptide beta-N-acetylglucosaminyltransferase [Xanthobacteraceae bacterium]|uniref:undecaprenyldiphospho-muramoylpentapeptide beta-N-acetylglucosaminyltransferase n=1 Tax=Pseudolabrys sp. TaxID=1960880 RepID=UPI003D0E3426